ncbi:MAG: hypothetical protein LQ340_003475 [Diploschistes diacapsis]|nr:MAG: hypothetical protein LQ340_003475 [Diploschistes diacapsis]
MAASVISTNSFDDRTGFTELDSLFAPLFDPGASLSTQFSRTSDEYVSRWDPAWDVYFELNPGPESTTVGLQTNTSRDHDLSSATSPQLSASQPRSLEYVIPKVVNAGKTLAADAGKIHETIDIGKPQEAVSSDPSSSTAEYRSTRLRAERASARQPSRQPSQQSSR